MARELTRIQVLPGTGRAVRTAQKAMRETGSIGTSPGEIAGVLGYTNRTRQQAPVANHRSSGGGCAVKEEYGGEGDLGTSDSFAKPQAAAVGRCPTADDRRGGEMTLDVTCDEAASTDDRQTPEVDAVGTDPSAVPAMSGHDRVNAVEPPSSAETAEARNVIVHNHGPAVAFYARPVDKATNGLTRGAAATG